VRKGADQFAHDLPEGVVRVGVILDLLQRFLAGHAAEDERVARIGNGGSCGCGAFGGKLSRNSSIAESPVISAFAEY
jgi:hypothetical protein